jgi:hypothetical protein
MNARLKRLRFSNKTIGRNSWQSRSIFVVAAFTFNCAAAFGAWRYIQRLEEEMLFLRSQLGESSPALHNIFSNFDLKEGAFAGQAGSLDRRFIPDAGNGRPDYSRAS